MLYSGSVVYLQVPIVKFTDCETAIKIDVGFSASISTGLQSVHFIKVVCCSVFFLF